MRENYRKPIASKEKLTQFITMNVIDGQAGLVRYSSLIFYSLTINNILNIIILVILAAVSIRAVTNMGIVGHAINGTQQYAEGAKAENEMLGQTATKLEDAVAKVKEIQGGSNPVGNEEGTILAALKDGTIKVGDYINYQTPKVEATYSSSITGAMTDSTTEMADQEFLIETADSNKMGWRVLGYGNAEGKLTLNKDEATNVLLIAANPIQQYLVLGKEQSYLNGPAVMNDLSSKFSLNGINAATNFITSQTTARSVNIEDLNTAFGITKRGTTILRNGTTIQGAHVESGLYNYSSADWEIGQSSVSYGTGTGKTENLDAYSYLISVGGNDDVIGHMLLDGTSASDYFTKRYWIASSGIASGFSNGRGYAYCRSRKCGGGCRQLHFFIHYLRKLEF